MEEAVEGGLAPRMIRTIEITPSSIASHRASRNRKPKVVLHLLEVKTLMLPVSLRIQKFATSCTNHHFPDGGYQNYVALWYQAMAQGGQPQPDMAKPPGTS